jgi:hypothetical protein
MDRYEWEDFDNIGILKAKLSEEQLKPLKDEIKKIQANPSLYTRSNSGLAGNIEYEYNLEESNKYVEELVLPYVISYDKQFKYLEGIDILSRSLPLGFDDPAWVNFMRKHEFNPNHMHTGVFSFVIWIDIPYSMEDEMKQDYCKSSNLVVPGHFEFLYINTMGEIVSYHIPADKTYNNTLIVFPAKLRHGVYPFATSDGVRISVSGNYKLIV